MPPRVAARRTLGLIVAHLVALALFACAEAPRAASAELDEGSGMPETDGGAFDPCVLKGTGCPCAEPGAVARCGTIKKQVGEYKLCTYGYRTCSEEQQWGECVTGPTLPQLADAGAPSAE